MKGALILFIIAVVGLGGMYLTQEPVVELYTAPQSIKATSLEIAQRATFLISFMSYNVSGSATLIGRKNMADNKYRYRALTAYHVVRPMSLALIKDKAKADHTMQVMFQPRFHGEPLRKQVLVNDIEWAIPSNDWAAFSFDMSDKMDCAQLATKEEFEAIKPFETIYAVGCGGQPYGQHCRQGIMGATHNEHGDVYRQKTANKPPPWNRHPKRFFRPYISVWYGDSGGAVYSKQGKLIGIINGFGIMGGWAPVTHSTVAFKTYIMLDVVPKNFFLVEDNDEAK